MRWWIGWGLLFACTTPPPPPPPAPPPPPPVVVVPSTPLTCSESEALLDTDPVAAQEALESCLDGADVRAATFRLLAQLRQEAGEHETAAQALREATRRFPDDVLTWTALARLEVNRGKLLEAQAAYREAMRLAPQDPLIGDALAALTQRLGTTEEKLAASLAPLFHEADGRLSQQDRRGALDALLEAERRAAGVPRLEAMVHHLIAAVHLSGGAWRDALHHLEAALALETAPPATQSERWLMRAEAHLSLGQAEPAAESARQAIALEPNNPLAHTNLALAQLAAGKREGLESLRRAIVLGLPKKLERRQLESVPAVQRFLGDTEFVAIMNEGWKVSAPGP